jgi:sodium/hydrogen antiporter
VLALGLLAFAVLAISLVARPLSQSPLTGPVVLVTVGLLAGWTGLVEIAAEGEVHTGHVEIGRELVLLVAEIGLALSLFTDAARLDLTALRGPGGKLPVRLLLIGMPLTIVLGAVLAAPFFPDLGLAEWALLAVILAPTDAGLGAVVITNRVVPNRIRQALNVESGLNDGLSMPFFSLFVALAIAEENVSVDGGWVRYAVEQIGYGVVIGVAVGITGGWLVRRAARRGWTLPVWEQLGLAALAVLAFFLADAAGGNGFIAAFTAGLTAGFAIGRLRERVVEFSEEEGLLLNLGIFLLFGLLAQEILSDTTWRAWVYALLSLTIVRMIPVALALRGTGLRPPTIGFIGWFGPRGIASIILALILVESRTELPQVDLIFGAVTATVLLSVYAHGLSAVPLSRRYGRYTAALPESAAEREDADVLAARVGAGHEPAPAER